MANARRSFRRTAPKRATFWEGFAVKFSTVTVGAPAFAVITTEAILENSPNPTLIRQRGSALVYANAGGATLDSTLFMGIMVADSRAIAVGITGLQLPFTNIGSDWLWWKAVHISDNSGSIDQIRPTTAAARFEIDGKAMRKIGLNEAVVLVLEVSDGGATALSATAAISARMLYKR